MTSGDRTAEKAEKDLVERLNRGIGRLEALTECVDVVTSALEAGDDFDVVMDWLRQQIDELRTEREVILNEWAEIEDAKSAS